MNMYAKPGILKRTIAAGLVAVLAFMLPGPQLSPMVSRAASKSVKYLGEVKLFVEKGADLSKAKSWCDSQDENKDDDPDNDWYVAEGDLNSGASDLLTNNYGVFFCYKTTTNEKDAIRDLAVMNEKGGYSESEYQVFLKKQKESYIDMIDNMKEMLDGYRTNYNLGVPMAVKAHDFLNGYIDDDSGKLLGDILLETEDKAELANLLLQANGQVVLAVQQQVASACDTGKTTWLDRLSKLGSFAKLKKLYVNAAKNNTAKAMDMLDEKYKETADVILDNWDDIQTRIDESGSILVNENIGNMSDAERDKWEKELDVTGDAFAANEDFKSLLALTAYKYDGKTLLDLFAKPKAEVEKNKREYIYPIAASLSEGQICALQESVGFFSLVRDALGANVYNDGTTAGKELDKKADAETKKEVKSTLDEIDELVKDVSKDKLSIYDGVDREIYDGGVAITTDASSYSETSETSWVSKFTSPAVAKKYAVYTAVGATVSAIMAGLFAYAERYMINLNLEGLIKYATEMNSVKTGQYGYDDMAKYMREHVIEDLKELNRRVDAGERSATLINNKLLSVVKRNSARVRIYNALKIGASVFAVMLAIADIAYVSYSLYKYYNTEHLPIPHHMLDMSYDEDKETSYVVYKNVKDQNDKAGDLNGGSSKQWLALYQTKDKLAGDPILASAVGAFKVQTGSDKIPTGYTPLHLFGTPNVAQNLTFADGENGWSYSDDNGGTYLFFTKDEGSIELPEEEEETDDTASGGAASGSGTDGTATVSSAGAGGVAVGTAAGVVAGLILGIVGTNLTRKRKNKSSQS